jgi:hypothetical protein
VSLRIQNRTIIVHKGWQKLTYIDLYSNESNNRAVKVRLHLLGAFVVTEWNAKCV